MPTKPLKSDEQAANDATNSDEQAAPNRREQAANGGEPFAAQWLTVAEVAEVLGVTPRTIQKRCKAGKLDARSVETPTGEQWEINPASVEKSNTEAANDAANTATNGGEQAANVRSEQAANVRSEQAPKSDEQAANRSQHQNEGAREYIADRRAAPLDWKERETEFKEQIQWLRNANEQHQRDAIELRQLLKKALEIAPRQLPAAPTDATAPTTVSAAPETAQGNAPNDAAANNVPNAPTEAAKSPQNAKTRPPKKEPRSFIKILLGMR
jgi:excisionase family DNA binding protein